ncbi:hypothetical protein [Prosthecobacter sp.]|uniref:hypothetical protein n=1 Tax=Prosthecobacter sp. TaxID=1965333 RepID=UPI0037830254
MSQGTPYHDPLDLKKNGCLWLLVIAGTIAGVIMLPQGLEIFFGKGHKKLHPQTIFKAIAGAVASYETEYGHFPIPESDWHGPDVSLRTRGPVVPALLGKEGPLNPKSIKFIDFPQATDRKGGQWQDGAEWVISDAWGEPYYITLDTNGDGRIANPECAADRSDPEYRKREKFPSPAELPLTIIVYSAGKDRDPKTWHDNPCSWRSR